MKSEGCPPAPALYPRQSAAVGNGHVAKVFSGRAGRVPQPPVPTPLGIAPVGLVQPGRGTFLWGWAADVRTGRLERELAVERLYFRCPTTGEEIDLGIESELGTLLRIRRSAVRARCPSDTNG